jgi:hypothetical protein
VVVATKVSPVVAVASSIGDCAVEVGIVGVNTLEARCRSGENYSLHRGVAKTSKPLCTPDIVVLALAASIGIEGCSGTCIIRTAYTIVGSDNIGRVVHTASLIVRGLEGESVETATVSISGSPIEISICSCGASKAETTPGHNRICRVAYAIIGDKVLDEVVPALAASPSIGQTSSAVGERAGVKDGDYNSYLEGGGSIAYTYLPSVEPNCHL